jgi:hypothetical protein
MKYQDVAVYNCADGYTVGGMSWARSKFQIKCQADGTYTAVEAQCMEPKMQVSGEFTDAQSGSLKLAGATVKFERGGAVLSTVTTDLSGRFTINIPKGELKMTGSLDGYITMSKTVAITGNVARGQGADMALSKVLPPGAWRTTVSWLEEPSDDDSHTYFGPNFNTHVYWPGRARTKTAAGTGGIKVVLDRDDVNGFGPETTTFMNLGNCQGTNRCLIKFQIKKYSGRVTLGEGKPIVRVFVGDKMEAEYHPEPPANIGRNLYTVFSLWGGADPKLYQGEMKEGPYLSETQQNANWWGSLDSAQWSTVPGNSLMTGMYRHPSGINRVYAIEEGRFRRLRNSQGTECYQQDWWGTFDHAGWAMCNPGYFMSGIYRTGNAWDGTAGVHQLEMAYCCKPKGLPNAYGECSEDAIFERNGASTCAADKAIAGLFRSSDNSINGIDKMKCCQLKSGLVAA